MTYQSWVRNSRGRWRATVLLAAGWRMPERQWDGVSSYMEWRALGGRTTAVPYFPRPCETCGEPPLETDAMYGRWCGDCSGACEREGCDWRGPAGELAVVESAMRGGISQDWCPDCRAQWAVRCGPCGGWVGEVYIYYSDCCDAHMCPDCWDGARGWCERCEETYCADCCGEEHGCRGSATSGLFNYSYRPELTFYGGGSRFLGMELEVCAGPAPVGTINEKYAHLLYCKEDSSVEGFEMVTHPMSYDWARENFPWGILDHIAEHGDAGPNGLHVHVNRSAFDDEDHVLAWLHLWYCNPAEVTAMARRNPERWAALEVPAANPTGALLDKLRRGSNRYTAINACNSDTLEVRVFASSLIKAEVLASLALVDASVEYARGADIGHLDWDEFGAWVFNHGDRYPELAEEMVRRVAVLDRPKPVVAQRSRPARDGGSLLTEVEGSLAGARAAALLLRSREPVARDIAGRWHNRDGRFTYAARYARDLTSPMARIGDPLAGELLSSVRGDGTLDGCSCDPCQRVRRQYDGLEPGGNVWQVTPQP